MKLRSKIKAWVTAFYAPNIQKYVSEYMQTDHYSSEQIEQYKMHKLQALLDFSYQHVPYYHRLFDSLGLKPTDFQSTSDLQRLPILTKEIIRREGSNMYADISQKGVKLTSTSGSSGHPVVLRKTKQAREIEQALMYRYKLNGGINPNNCSLVMWGGHSFSFVGSIRNKIKQWLLNEYLFDTYHITDKSISDIISILNTGKVSYLRGYTSAVYYVAQEILARGLCYNIPFVSVSAEKLLDSQRTIIEKAFGPNLFDQYGCGECGAIAYECKEHNGLHHNFEHSVLEVLDDNNSPAATGRVVLTNLDNYAMPLIRYENGDMVTLSDTKCACGRQSMLIKCIEGRTYDMIYGENGRKVHAALLTDVLLNVDVLTKYPIKQWQIVQKEPLLFICKYIAPYPILEIDRIEMERIYQKYLGEHVQLIMMQVDWMYIPKSGKRHYVIPYEKYLANTELYD